MTPSQTIAEEPSGKADETSPAPAPRPPEAASETDQIGGSQSAPSGESNPAPSGDRSRMPSGTGAGRSDAPHSGIGAQDSAAINANLAGLAAGTVQLVG